VNELVSASMKATTTIEVAYFIKPS